MEHARKQFVWVFRAASLVAVLVSAPMFFSGCKTMGPRVIRGDRFNYNAEGSNSTNEQILLNLVRLRYGEPLYFLEIASIVSQYTFEASAEFQRVENNLNVWNNPALRAAYGVDNDPSRIWTWGVNAGYSDRPTITYNPLQGEAFAKRIMSGIPLLSLSRLGRAGWRSGLLFDLCVQQINGVRNIPIHKRPGVEVDESDEFRQLGDILDAMQDSGSVREITSADSSGRMGLYMQFAPGVDEEDRELLAEFCHLLGLREGLDKYRLVDGSYRIRDDEIVLEMRSMLGTMYALSRNVEVPEVHAAAGLIGRGGWLTWWQRDKLGGEEREAWLRVRYSELPVADAYVQIRHKGYWFYVAEDDWNSKRTIALLSNLFSLQAAPAESASPVLTVPLGG